MPKLKPAASRSRWMTPEDKSYCRLSDGRWFRYDVQGFLAGDGDGSNRWVDVIGSGPRYAVFLADTDRSLPLSQFFYATVDTATAHHASLTFVAGGNYDTPVVPIVIEAWRTGFWAVGYVLSYDVDADVMLTTDVLLTAVTPGEVVRYGGAYDT